MANRLELLLIATCIIIFSVNAALPESFPASRGYEGSRKPLVGGQADNYRGEAKTPENTQADLAITTSKHHFLKLEVNPQQFGAKGDGLTDDTAALKAAAAAVPVGGVIHLPAGTYKTTGWLITKTVSVVADAPCLFRGSSAATLKAAGAQPYVLKFQGVYGDASGASFLHPLLISI